MAASLFLKENLAYLRNNIVKQIVRWLKQPKVWRFVSFTSSFIGFLCYALSSSFNHLFGNWNLLKIFLYTVFSFIICLAIFFANKWQNSPSLRLRAHLVFSIFTITTVYSFFFDKANGKPDVYSLVSGAAFAITSLGLSKQSHFGFEVDLLYFFCGYLILQLMKIKFILVIAGVCFSYPLIILRFYLHAPTEHSEELTNAADYHAIQVDASQVNFDSLVAPDLTFDALHENGDLRLQQEDSLVVVNQINSLSQQDNSDDNDHNRLVLYRKPLARMNLINQETSHILILVPQHTDYRISCLEDFTNMIHKILDVDGFSIEPTSKLVQIMEANYEIFKMNLINQEILDFTNMIHKILDVDGLSIEPTSELVQIMEANYEILKMNLSARALYTFDFLNLKISPISRVSLLENKIKIPRVPSLGIRQRRGSKLRSQQLKEMIDAMENNDVVRDNYKERLLEYHKYL